MSYISILVVSFLATLSLASPVARQTAAQCPSGGSGNAANFSLIAVSQEDVTNQWALAIGFNGGPSIPFSDSYLVVCTIYFGNLQLLRLARELISHKWNADSRLYRYSTRRSLLYVDTKRNVRILSERDLRWRVAARS